MYISPADLGQSFAFSPGAGVPTPASAFGTSYYSSHPVPMGPLDRRRFSGAHAGGRGATTGYIGGPQPEREPQRSQPAFVPSSYTAPTTVKPRGFRGWGLAPAPVPAQAPFRGQTPVRRLGRRKSTMTAPVPAPPPPPGWDDDDDDDEGMGDVTPVVAGRGRFCIRNDTYLAAARVGALAGLAAIVAGVLCPPRGGAAKVAVIGTGLVGITAWAWIPICVETEMDEDHRRNQG